VRCAERAAADWLDAEAALLFPSGYQANLGVVGALATRGDAVFSDALNHASLVDAARLSRARVHVHAHLNLEELAHNLAREGGARRRIVLTESVFSMDGDLAPLEELHDLCRTHDAWLIIDEAHAAGLLGPGGAGAWAALGTGNPSHLAARIVTGGKALGVAGAFVAGSRALVDICVNKARTQVFTTAPPPAIAACLAAAIEVCRGADSERAGALGLARQMAAGLGLHEPDAAIVPLVLGSPEAALAAADALQAAGFAALAVRPPTVPAGTSRVRIACHVDNTAAEVDEAIRILVRFPRPGDTPGATEKAHPLFVVGTDTGIGKTVVSALIMRAASQRGAAHYWKPVQTGSDDDTAEVQALSGAEAFRFLRPAWSLELPASPHEAAAAQEVDIDPARIEGALAALLKTLPNAVLVVELAGGILVPYRSRRDGEPPFTQADWLARAAPPLVLVARSGLGTLNHTLLTLEALRARHLEPQALFLVGEPHPSNRQTLAEMGQVERIFEVPLFDALDTAALDGWLQDHDLSVLFPEVTPVPAQLTEGEEAP